MKIGLQFKVVLTLLTGWDSIAQTISLMSETTDTEIQFIYLNKEDESGFGKNGGDEKKLGLFTRKKGSADQNLLKLMLNF